MNAKIDVTTRKKLRKAMLKIKNLNNGFLYTCECGQEIEVPGIKTMEKDKEVQRVFIKEMCDQYKTDFDFPEGKTEWRESERVGYDTKELDELIESGTIDSDTAALIRKTRKTIPIRSMYIV